MRPASHANLHLINTRGVFAARAACVPICAFKPNFGKTAFLFNALKSGDIDIYPEFTGTDYEIGRASCRERV